MEIYISIGSLDKLADFAHILTKHLDRGSVLCLGGELGAGKTTLTKYIAKNLGVEGNVTSPTFNILKIYKEGIIPLYHIDAYRLEDIGYDLELDDYIYGSGIAVIEWYKFISSMLPDDCLYIDFELENETRVLRIKGDKKYDKFMEEISNRYSD